MKQRLFIATLIASAIFLSARCHGEPVGGVMLTIGQQDTNAIVSWPYPSTGFGLEFATNLSATNWQPAAGTSVSNNGHWAVTTPLSPPSGLFR